MSTDGVDWNSVLSSGYGGMLGWLEYSLRRALGMEGTEEAERKLGEEQILGTISTLEKYERQAGTLLEWLYFSE